jgi:hypothetical protein
MGLPFASIPSDFTFICPNMLEQTTCVFFRVSGVILDFRSFSFQVPICGSAAKHTALAKKQSARVNPIVFFISLDRIGISNSRQWFSKLNSS